MKDIQYIINMGTFMITLILNYFSHVALVRIGVYNSTYIELVDRNNKQVQLQSLCKVTYHECNK